LTVRRAGEAPLAAVRAGWCSSVSIRRGRVAWIDDDDDERATLHRLDVRTGRRWRWRLPGAGSTALRAGPALYVSVGRRVYRARS
jgi:hypothetical protein